MSQKWSPTSSFSSSDSSSLSSDSIFGFGGIGSEKHENH
jgi:hypothetical protein